MSISTFCFLIAFVELLFGIPMLFRPEVAGRRIIRLLEHELLYPLLGGATVLLCAAPLIEQPVPAANLDGFMRVIAWIGAAKGVAICWMTTRYSRFAAAVFGSDSRVRLFGMLATLAGVILLLAGVSLRS